MRCPLPAWLKNKQNRQHELKKTRPYIVALTLPFCEPAQILRGLKANYTQTTNFVACKTKWLSQYFLLFTNLPTTFIVLLSSNLLILDLRSILFFKTCFYLQQ
jgi:hypothetical protein